MRNFLILFVLASVTAPGFSEELQPTAQPVEVATTDSSSVNVKENFSKVSKDMSEDEVFALLGAPSNIGNHMSGKVFVPFYFGGDAQRIEWKYEGVGLVVFSKNRYTSKIAVIKTVEAN